jgi:hypothetical protein
MCRDAAAAHFECLRIAAAAQENAEKLAPMPLGSCTPPKQKHTPSSPMMGLMLRLD